MKVILLRNSNEQFLPVMDDLFETKGNQMLVPVMDEEKVSYFLPLRQLWRDYDIPEDSYIYSVVKQMMEFEKP